MNEIERLFSSLTSCCIVLGKQKQKQKPQNPNEISPPLLFQRIDTVNKRGRGDSDDELFYVMYMYVHTPLRSTVPRCFWGGEKGCSVEEKKEG